MHHSCELVFDGGSIGNPGRAYGSFRWRIDGGNLSPPNRREFGHGTNNQAEYRALIAALEAVLGELSSTGADPNEARLTIRGDSRLVLKQVAGEWKIKNKELKKLFSEASALLAKFESVRFIHQDRSETVRTLGH